MGIAAYASSWPFEPKVEETVKNFGLFDLDRRGSVALKRKMAPRVLVLKGSRKSFSVAVVEGPWRPRMPELATTTSRWVMLCSNWRVEMADLADSGMEASYFTTINLLPLPVGRDERVWVVEWLGSRTRAMAVVFGRAR